MNLGLTIRDDAGPIYQQLFDQIADRVRTGAWPAGYRLPATRALAGELRTHRNTIVRAFEELTAAGYLVSVVGRGTFVAERPVVRPWEAPSTGGLPWASLLSSATEAEPIARIERYRRSSLPSGAVNLTRMQPSVGLLPHTMLRRCVDHVLRTLGPLALGYAPREGVLALREQLARELAERGVPARADDVLVTTGSQQALDVIARALVNPGDRFLVDGTTYTGALHLLVLAGAQVLGVPSDEEGPDLAWLRRLSRGDVKGLYVMPNCHNPTGLSISGERRRALIAWSHEVGVPIIEDDYGADLELDAVPPPPYLRALDSEVIYVSTFSKKLIPALRVGFVVCPPALREPLVSIKHAMDLGTSALLQYALAEFLERGYLKRHYAEVLPEYRRRRDVLVEALRRHLPAEVTFSVPPRGVVIWLRLPLDLDPEEVHDAARREGVVISPSTLHAVGRDHAGVRLTFCAEPAERLAEGARRLGRALDNLRREPHRRRQRPASPVAYGV
jgi:2-aminoadipate transaminase